MKRGVWHQCAHNSQILVKEQLEAGNGVGVILSPRDLARPKAIPYSETYHTLGADVLLDQQFHVPDFANANLESYATGRHRAGVSDLNRLSDSSLDALTSDLEETNRQLGTSAVVAPAVIYEAGRNDIVSLNHKFFSAARRAAEVLGVPTYATVVLGRSATTSMQTLSPLLSQVTSLSADGWYFAFEFDAPRIPGELDDIERAGQALLTLACTGQPVLQAYAGPMGLLSFGFGATAVGVGHSQNTWQFTPDRWRAPTGQGGGGDAPPRFFSSSIWGTLIFPDETARLPISIAADVMTLSPFSVAVSQGLTGEWSRWEANKHLVYTIGQTLTAVSAHPDAKACAREADAVLTKAVSLHNAIAASGLRLADNTNSYQANWLLALNNALQASASDYDYLEMLP